MDFVNWCRLCGNFEAAPKVDPEIVELVKTLNTEIITENIRICEECSNYLSGVILFVQKTKLIQNMFLELECETSTKNEDQLIIQQSDSAIDLINNVRSRYGLELVDNKGQDILESLFNEESDISPSALDIKIENEIQTISLRDTLTEVEAYEDDAEELDGIEEEDELESDTSSNIEQLSESKLRIKFNESQSEEDENEQSDRPRRKRLRKTDEEKCFDFLCHVCNQEFNKMSQLSGHCRKIHNCLPQVMCFCGKILATWKRLLIHKQKHFPEKYDYECKECKMVYKMKASYLNHMKQKHGPDAKKFVCHQCARCFKDSRTLITHEKTHLPNELKLIYPCDICQKRFVNKNSLKSHITSVHEMASLYTCEQCGKSFSTKSNLKSHLYSHSTEKNVQCDVCSARFKNMDSLRKHKKTHLEKSHACTICGNRYRNKNNLKAHMVCHSEDKPYKCTYCPNEYKRSKDLKCHMNLHSGERPYQCQFCSRTFVNGSNCRKHKLKDHPEELATFEATFGKGKAAVFALQTIKSDV